VIFYSIIIIIHFYFVHFPNSKQLPPAT